MVAYPAGKSPACWRLAIPPPGSPIRSIPVACLTALLALALGVLFSASGFGRRLDNNFLDNLCSAVGRPRPVSDPVIILINQADYAAKATPLALWGRYLTPLLDRIEAAGPSLVGLDLVLPQFPLFKFIGEQERDFYKILNRIAKNARLVSGYAIGQDGRLMEPLIFYRKILGEAGYGFLNVTPDGDGVCRRQTVAVRSREGRDLQSFASLCAGVRPPAGRTIVPDWRNPAVFQTYSYQQALAAGEAEFAGKVVLIGLDLEFEDRHQSPARRGGEAGVVIQARMVEALMSRALLLDPGWLLSLIIPAAPLLVAGMILTRRTSPSRVFLTGLASLTGLLAVETAALSAGIILRFSAGVASLVLFHSATLVRDHFKVREVFGRYIAPEVRDEILSGKIPLDGDLKRVTVLFADLRNFTPLVESNPPKEVVRILNTYFAEMSLAVREMGGLVLQYAGDEIYAVFGAPVASSDHARAAVRAALAMRRRLLLVNEKLGRTGREALRHGIGIHTGEAVAANIGGGDRATYALIGDVVNLGSRFQGLTKEFDTDIILSGETKAHLGDEFPMQRLPQTRVRGSTGEFELYALL